MKNSSISILISQAPYQDRGMGWCAQNNHSITLLKMLERYSRNCLTVSSLQIIRMETNLMLYKFGVHILKYKRVGLIFNLVATISNIYLSITSPNIQNSWQILTITAYLDNELLPYLNTIL